MAISKTSLLFFIKTFPIKFKTPILKLLTVVKISNPFPGEGSKKFFGLKFESKRAAREGDSVFVAAQDKNPHKIGVVTSGSISPSLNKAIAIANVDYDEYKEGDILSVEIRNNIYSAEVCSFPFYKNGSVRGD